MVPPSVLFLMVDVALVVGGLLAVQYVATRPWPPRRVAIAVAAICSAAFIIVFTISEPISRFADLRRAYYPAGAAVLQDQEMLAPLIERGVHGFVNLPIVAYIFAPFGALPWQGAAAAFLLVGLVLTFAAWRALSVVAELDRRTSYLLLFLIAAGGPVVYSLREGNTSHMMLLGLVGGLHLLRRGRHVAAGALLAVLAVVKLPLMLFGVYFILRRTWMAVLGFSAVCAAAGLASLAVFGWEMNLLWFDRCVRQFASNPLGAFNVQSLQALLMRLVEGPDVLRLWDAQPISTAQRLAGTLLGGLLYLAVIIVVCMARAPDRGTPDAAGRRLTLEYLIVVCLAVIGSPLSWTHYYAWLLLPIAFLLAQPSPIVDGPRTQRLSWLAILFIMPAVLLPDLSGNWLAVYSAAGVSLPLLGGLIIYGLTLRAWAMPSHATASQPSRRWERYGNARIAEPS